MSRHVLHLLVLAATSCPVFAAEPRQQQQVTHVAQTRGLIAFWDFALMKNGVWTSYHDKNVVDRGYPVYLRRIGDPNRYTPAAWPDTDEASKLVVDSSGPFGHAVRFNKGHIFAEVPRNEFDGTPLDIHGRQPFTLVAWVKFIGDRHLVAGIWDEGGWDKYRGRRQIALFGGLFGSRGLTAHISSTGAASYPQSTAPGSQYARCRAIDGRGFDNGQWVALAMTFDPAGDEVTAYLNGVATPLHLTDPVAQAVFRHEEPVAANPFHFPWPIYSPTSFILKFNGYDVRSSGVYEHRLQVDARKGVFTYGRSRLDTAKTLPEYRVRLDVSRGGESLLPAPIVFLAEDEASVDLPNGVTMTTGDEIMTSLQVREDGDWRQVGTEIRYPLREGAPFTFGRALGLGHDPEDRGTQLYIDGVAVFNRVLSERELKELGDCR